MLFVCDADASRANVPLSAKFFGEFSAKEWASNSFFRHIDFADLISPCWSML